MKKLITLALIALMATPIYAQYETSRQRSRYNHKNTERYYGIRLGLNSATLNSDKVQMDMEARTGLSLGFVYGMQLANSMPLWLEAGAFYSEKGGKSYNNLYADFVDHITCRLTYVEVPVVIKYGFDVADDLYIQPFVGGFLGIGIAGKTKVFTKDESRRKSMDSYSSISVLNNSGTEQVVYEGVGHFDAGLRLGCGLEYQMLYAEVGMEFGLANIGKDDFESVRTQNLFINIGVNF